MSNATPTAPGTPAFPPQPPAKKPRFHKRHPVTTVFLIIAFVGLLFMGGCAALVGSAMDEATKQANPATHTAGKKDASTTSATGKFKQHINTTGTAQEKAAASHITRVQTSMGDADIHTNLSGDMASPSQGTATLLAQQYASWKTTDSGASLVTVYGANGDMLANANY